MFKPAASGGCLISKEIALLNFFFIAGQSNHSGKFKHLKYSENVNFEGTSSVDSILIPPETLNVLQTLLTITDYAQ